MKGFTLIELIVTLGITAIMMTGLIANYISYTANQEVKQTAISFKTNLRLAYTKATNGEKPSDGSTCGQLLGYQFTVTSTMYAMQAECLNGAVIQLVGPITSVTIPSSIKITASDGSFLFQVLNRGVDISSADLFTFTGRLSSYQIQLTPQGEITDLGFQ